MFIGMMLVDAALAAWAVGILGQPFAPRWVRGLLFFIPLSLALSVVGVVTAVDAGEPHEGFTLGLTEKTASLIGPTGALIALAALVLGFLQQRQSRLRQGKV